MERFSLSRRPLPLVAAGLLAALGVAPTARGADAPSATFPRAWVGVWKGDATTKGPEGDGPAFSKELEIAPTADPKRWTWTLRFAGAAGAQERPYVLVERDAAKGLFAIDEGQGVLIEATFVDGALHASFEVDGARISTRERVEGLGTAAERMTSELVTTLRGREVVVGGKDGIPKISSWPVVNVQAATLRRTGAPRAARPTAPAAAPPEAGTPTTAGGPDEGLEALARAMEGTFSSAAQAKADPEFRDIRLAMRRIWADRADGPWFYVEQATATSTDKPYRQRIYRIERPGGDMYLSHVYTLSAPEQAVGAATDPSRLAAESHGTIRLLEGCTVVLLRVDATTWRGSTLGSACGSSFGKAVYATSEVTVTPEGLHTWDRGHDATGAQVWGSTKGPYVFVRDGR